MISYKNVEEVSMIKANWRRAGLSTQGVTFLSTQLKEFVSSYSRVSCTTELDEFGPIARIELSKEAQKPISSTEFSIFPAIRFRETRKTERPKDNGRTIVVLQDISQM